MRVTELIDPALFKLATLTSSAVSGATSVAVADWTMELFGVPVSVFLACFAGALVSLSFLPPPADESHSAKNVRGMAAHVASGTLLAAFGQPLAIFGINHFLKPEVAPAEIGLGIAGLLGALLMAVLPIVFNYLKNKFGGAT